MIFATVRARQLAFISLSLFAFSAMCAATFPGRSAANASPTRSPKQSSAIPAPSARIYWGAAIGTQYTGTEPPWSMQAVSDFQKITRKAPSIIHFYGYWGNCVGDDCTGWAFPTSSMTAIRQGGQIPMLSWGSEASDGTPAHNALYSLDNIIDGSLDGYIRRFAEAAKRWRHPFFLRFDWEMNGNWFPWGLGTDGNTASKEVQAWRHVHDIFSSVGATNVTWDWCPNIVASGNGSTSQLRRLYPGSAYVDWTCLDGYNWGTTESGLSSGGWKSFSQLYSPSYKELQKIAPHKPMMVGEFASTATGGSKADWIKNALSIIPMRFPAIRAIAYFDEYASDMDWPLDTSPSVEQAFAAGISNAAYVGKGFDRLPARIISPL